MTDNHKFNAIIVILTVLLAVSLVLLYQIIKKEPGPHDELINYLEAQRDSMHAYQKSIQEKITRYDSLAIARQQKDSAVDLARQSELLKSINKLQASYEKIPAYTNIGNDSLRRIFAEKFR